MTSLETEFYFQIQVYIFDPCPCFIHNVLKKSLPNIFKIVFEFERAQIITGFKYCAPYYYYFPSLVAGLALICTKKTGCVKFTSVLCNFLEPQCSCSAWHFFGFFFKKLAWITKYVAWNTLFWEHKKSFKWQKWPLLSSTFNKTLGIWIMDFPKYLHCK